MMSVAIKQGKAASIIGTFESGTIQDGLFIMT